jgi:CDP-paratose 2-epimerase
MRVFITGGAGFIGSNSAAFFLARGHQVTIFDNFSRPGTAHNRAWLEALAKPGQLQFIVGDIRQTASLEQAISAGTQLILHLAAQVAVTTSVSDPRTDFDINAAGTFNVLEAMRRRAPQACLIYSSTNKVYGGLEKRAVKEEAARYRFIDRPLGIDEEEPLDFHSPYGCSKGCGDQYVRDYARIYGLRTVVFRQSCVYGHRQFGVEDQGWAAHFCIAAMKGRPIRIYGNGKQVRDMLWIDDLIRAFESAFERADAVAGGVYNIGGGPDNTLSIWKEFEPFLRNVFGKPIPAEYHPPRPGDQPIYISDIRKAKRELGWQPAVSFPEGLDRLCQWLKENATALDVIP